VKFIGDQADNSRGSISEETKEKFKKAMMEQPGANFAIPSTDEEDIKKQVLVYHRWSSPEPTLLTIVCVIHRLRVDSEGVHAR
jgi:hypothetical protein